MPFLQLTLDIGAIDPAPFEELLSQAGALSIMLQDAGDDPVLEPAPGTTPLWPSVRLSALFDAQTDAQLLQTLLQAHLPAAASQLETLEDRVWEREWLKDFKPMRFGQRLWICPGEQLPPADLLPPLDAPRSTPVIIQLDPGLAFGTGTHPTTALCLEWLDGAALEGRRILDYGCGSGVLAIAALKLGAAHAVAVDIDPQALTATLDNARHNEVGDRILVQGVAEMASTPVDILLANILAEPLEQLAPRLAELVSPGGHLVLSGLLQSQAERIAMRYSPWFEIAPIAVREDWARVTGTRRS